MAERTKTTMRDVARLARVSITTVSAVVNKTAPVGSERKKRVLDAMSALDYQPDAIARGLKTGRTHVLGVIVPDITNAFYPEMIRGVEAVAQKTGYSVLLCDSSENPQNEEKHLNTLSSRRVDGILLACCANSTAPATAIRRQFPIVFVDRIPPEVVPYTVSSDNTLAGYTASQHLIGLGHERIAMLVGHLGLSPHRDRLEGFRKAMQEHHLAIRDEYLVTGEVQIEDGLNAGRRLLRLPDPPTAIMVSNNKLLLGVLQALEEHKSPVPELISVLGFDDYIWNQYFNPSLTAVAQQSYEMGQRACELLLQVINAPQSTEVPETHISLKTRLLVRNSTAIPYESQKRTEIKRNFR
jgi:LacI family transcriptional regulator